MYEPRNYLGTSLCLVFHKYHLNVQNHWLTRMITVIRLISISIEWY